MHSRKQRKATAESEVGSGSRTRARARQQGTGSPGGCGQPRSEGSKWDLMAGSASSGPQRRGPLSPGECVVQVCRVTAEKGSCGSIVPWETRSLSYLNSSNKT